ncbi:MAG TPA: hypothetical protein VMZ28_26840 [Kofleriaceae bacterium]|nr:hypothetical protein [Kofleriaceae bacterium]
MRMLVCLLTVSLFAPAAAAQSRRKNRKKPPAAAATPAPVPAGDARPAGKKKEKVFDFTGFELAGSVRMPQLLYFLDRAEEELERASLERRSFVPAMLKSLDEEKL